MSSTPPSREAPAQREASARTEPVITLLLVDDEPRNLDALEAVLADPAYRLLRACDADAALRLLLENDVAAIVLDIKMPGTSGFELAKMIKATKRFRQIPILFLTAYLVDDQDVIAGYGTGAVDYLTKPVHPQILRHKVAVYAELFRKTRALAELNETLEQRVKERTAMLEKSEAALREASDKKDQFIAVLSHELRNPLAPIRFGLELLQTQLSAPSSGAPSPVVKKALATMNRQLDHMVHLLDDLLDVSRVSHGLVELKKERVDLETTLETALDTVRPLFDRRRQALSIQLHDKVFTHADPTRIAQVIGNLLHNAAKFTPEGGRVEIELAREENEAVIRVTDSGEGLSPEQLELAFQMFARIPRSEASVSGGLGIGLALARQLAELHGGSLSATSAGIGRGATFTLRLPALAEVAVPAAKPSNGPVQIASGLNIVIVEDSEDIAEMLAALLEDMGHSVAVAGTGMLGVELVGQHRPNVVLCDLGLPDIDGLEVCRQVRALSLQPQPVMVALTGWGRDEDRRGSTAAGFNHHLVKPVSFEKLERLLRTVPN